MTPQDQQQQQQPQLQSIGAEQVRDQDKIHLVLSYISILGLIPLLTVKDSPFVRYHAKQGLALNLIGGLVSSVLAGFMGIGCLLGLAVIVIDIVAIMKALKGERWNIPLVTDAVAKF